MNKVLVTAVVGSGSAAALVGGAYLLQQDNKVSNEIPAKNWQEFKGGDKSGECVTKYFEDFNFPTNDTAFSSTNKVDSSYFSSSSGSKSCLVVNWEKKGPASADNSKWSGTLRWVGSFVDGNKGFVMFTLIKPSTTNATLELEGGIYVLEKTGTEGGGTVKGSQEVNSSNKTISASDFSDKFPTVGNALGLDDVDLKNNWGFIKNSSTELGKLCKSGDTDNCPSATDSAKEFKGSGTGEKTGTGSERWSKGSENTDQWIEKLYPKSDAFDLVGALGASSSTKGINPNLTKPSDKPVSEAK